MPKYHVVSEAEYVYRLRKDFVPLRLQEDYVPDGWLGIMVGTRLYFDIYTEEKVDVQIPRLAKELRDRGKISPYDIGERGKATLYKHVKLSRKSHNQNHKTVRGGSRISGKGVHKNVGVCFADLI